MKIILQHTFLILALNVFSINAMALKTIDQTTQQQDTTSTETLNAYFFVSARSGLNYRTSPKGEILGKFPLNTKLKVIYRSKVLDQVTDSKKTLKGEWLGVEKELDTVYVFSGFLSSSLTESNLKIYVASPYYKYENEIRQGFINVSESYYESDCNMDKPSILYKKDLGKDTIQFDRKQRAKFLKKLNISELDTVFVYNITIDSIIKYDIKNLPLIATVNIYASGDDNLSEFDYEFGFNLGASYQINGGTFVTIGKENPFQTSKAKAILWKSMDIKDFPVKFDVNIVDESIRSWFDDIILKEAYKFKNNNFDYYVQNLENDGNILSRHLVIVDTTTTKVVFNDVYIDSEGTYLVPLNIENNKPEWGKQWTGEIFKNKPSIVYGFISASFGCPSIQFLSETEPSISVLCDNRH